MAKKTRDGLFRRGPIWWLRTDPVTRKQRTTRCRDLAAAKLFRSERERIAASPRSHAADKETVASACDRLIADRHQRGKATLFHEQKTGHWVRLFGERKLAEVEPETFDEYVRARREDGASDHTITKEVGCFLRALKLAKRLRLYPGDLSVLRPLDLSSGYVPRKRALSPVELAALLENLPKARHPAIAIMVGLGVRYSEAFGLERRDIDLEEWTVEIRGTKTEGANRIVPVLRAFRGLVESAAAHVPLEPWQNSRRDILAACKRAKIAPVTANDLRRTHATLLRSAKVDPDTARRLLGHTPGSKMLETVYDQPTPRELEERAGDLATLTQQLAGLESVKPLRVWRDSNSRPTAPENAGRQREIGIPRAKQALETCGEAQGADAGDTLTQHSPLAWSLALAAERMGIGRAC